MNGIKNLCIPPRLSPDVDLKPVLIRLTNVGLKRDRRVILENVNLSIRRGDLVAITGPNGGGKTTLIRIILGLLTPTKGKVEFLQKNVKIGCLPQKSNVDSHYPITVKEVIASGLTESVPDLNNRIEETLTMVELTDHANKAIGMLSGGQLQRTLLARAIISRPEVLVLDEPLSYIDKHFEKKIYDLIRELAKTTTIIMVSHEVTTAASIANRHLIVDRTITECKSAHHFTTVALCEP